METDDSMSVCTCMSTVSTVGFYSESFVLILHPRFFVLLGDMQFFEILIDKYFFGISISEQDYNFTATII